MGKGVSSYFYILKNRCSSLSKTFYVEQNRQLFPIILVIDNFQFSEDWVSSVLAKLKWPLEVPFLLSLLQIEFGILK